ncbi:hypothetical protein MHPYR_90144 [uncultured Mycobacterium sp.]|uniref:Uncharacterized protein n=1 Tax=uncultured Mycobacterium sp. TaxID=171292 RepID=A0A1Y5PMB0_9MYCO|nr:hypothetical protein MHPYR_90144 [uncultured Mycobacterium sp.]
MARLAASLECSFLLAGSQHLPRSHRSEIENVLKKYINRRKGMSAWDIDGPFKGIYGYQL